MINFQIVNTCHQRPVVCEVPDNVKNELHYEVAKSMYHTEAILRFMLAKLRKQRKATRVAMRNRMLSHCLTSEMKYGGKCLRNVRKIQWQMKNSEIRWAWQNLHFDRIRDGSTVFSRWIPEGSTAFPRFLQDYPKLEAECSDDYPF